MCTSIVEVVGADGAGKGGDGWFDVTHAVVSYDHPHHALYEDAINIDFVNPALGPSARVAVEISLESAKELCGALARAIAAAEVEETRKIGQSSRGEISRSPSRTCSSRKQDPGREACTCAR